SVWRATLPRAAGAFTSPHNGGAVPATLQKVTLTLAPPIPSLSPAGFAAAAALVLLAAGWAMRRHLGTGGRALIVRAARATAQSRPRHPNQPDSQPAPGEQKPPNHPPEPQSSTTRMDRTGTQNARNPLQELTLPKRVSCSALLGGEPWGS